MKRKTPLIFLLLLWIALPSWAQDTLTVMQYNLLYYGNYNSGFADCYETNNNTQRKDECVRTIVDYVKPDIFTVCEFGATAALQNNFLRHNLNINGANYWQSDNIINYAGENIINHIFYDSRKLGLKKHIALRTNPRDTDVYELYLKTKSLAAGDTVKLICIVAHLKAGQGYEASRRAQIQTAMDYLNQHYPHDNALIMGDFNMYGASESGYRLLTQTYSNPDILFIDPLGSAGVGEWNCNGQFAAYHTQSTRSYSDECFSAGGLDDLAGVIGVHQRCDDANRIGSHLGQSVDYASRRTSVIQTSDDVKTITHVKQSAAVHVQATSLIVVCALLGLAFNASECRSFDFCSAHPLWKNRILDKQPTRESAPQTRQVPRSGYAAPIPSVQC